MGISMSNAVISKRKDEKRVKLKPGRHLVRCTDLRERETRSAGLAFFLDFVVLQGPTQVGFESVFDVYPENVRVKPGGLSRAEVQSRELGKIQTAVAAVAGHVREAASVVNDEFYQRAVATQARIKNPGTKSPLAGALFEVLAVAGEGDKGPYVFYEVYPHIPGESEFTSEAGAPEAAEPRAKVPPVRKAPSVFPPAPWQVHPDDKSYVFREDTEQCITVEELKALMAEGK